MLSVGAEAQPERAEIDGACCGKKGNQRPCDVFSGRWVFDNASRPLYQEALCPYMSDQLACVKHGRLDTHYQNWRWQPHSCDLKRWDPGEMLEKLRGKRLVFVGDSLNRGQWISMICLLQSVIPLHKHSISPNASLSVFTAQDYNTTIEFFWAPLLVESNSDDPVNHRLAERVIRPDSILNHASKWGDADILVFNSYLWWRRGHKIKLLYGEGQENGEAEGVEGMRLALQTWAEWVESHVDPLKQKVLFVTTSPTHQRSKDWDHRRRKEGNCFQETEPIRTGLHGYSNSYWGSGSDRRTMRVVDGILGRLAPTVSVLNITQLSDYRKDGHPSVYRKFWEVLSPEQLADPSGYADCIHWCLPGVPDVWNELLFNVL